MDANELQPRWMRELTRMISYKSQIYLYGNIHDTVLYPIGEEQQEWTLGTLRAALFELFRHYNGGYEVIGAYNLLDGMVFADAREKNVMSKLYDSMVAEVTKAKAAAKDATPENPQEANPTLPEQGRAPQKVQPRDRLGHVLHHIHACLLNRQHPCAFIMENGSQLLPAPLNLQESERINFLRLLKASGESQVVAQGEGSARRVRQNLSIILCDKLTDMPTWLYLNNPFCGSIEIDPPHGYERRHFFDLFVPAPNSASQMAFDTNDLVDLTDGMTIRDLCGIRSLARRPEQTFANAKSLIDCYKYGVQQSEWDNLDWHRLETAEDDAFAARHRAAGGGAGGGGCAAARALAPLRRTALQPHQTARRALLRRADGGGENRAGESRSPSWSSAPMMPVSASI